MFHFLSKVSHTKNYYHKFDFLLKNTNLSFLSKVDHTKKYYEIDFDDPIFRWKEFQKIKLVCIAVSGVRSGVLQEC